MQKNQCVVPGTVAKSHHEECESKILKDLFYKGFSQINGPLLYYSRKKRRVNPNRSFFINESPLPICRLGRRKSNIKQQKSPSKRACSALKMVVQARIELATHGFSVDSCKDYSFACQPSSSRKRRSPDVISNNVPSR
jgi:hypothetical protein